MAESIASGVEELGCNLDLFPPELLLRILEFLPVRTLNLCRLVSRKMNHCSVKILNRMCSLNVRTSADITRYCSKVGTFVLDSVPSLQVEAIYFRDSLFQEIIDHIISGRGGEEKISVELHKLGEFARRHVTKLYIEFYAPLERLLALPSAVEQIRKVINQILFVEFKAIEKLEVMVDIFQPRDGIPGPNGYDNANPQTEMDSYVLPNLKILSVRCHGKWTERPELKELGMLVKSLPKFATNLKTLIWHANISTDPGDRLDVMCLRINDLNVGDLSTEAIRALSKCNFPNLESLRVSKIRWDVDNLEDVVSFLSRYAGTLTEINIVSDENILLKFPPHGVILQALENLTLTNILSTLVWENMPKLGKLGFNRVTHNPAKLYTEADSSQMHLRNFFWQIDEKGEALENFYPSLASPLAPLWFTSLTSLQLSFYPNIKQVKLTDILPKIFEKCVALEELQVNDAAFTIHYSCLDACITGIALSDLPIFEEMYTTARTNFQTPDIIFIVAIAHILQIARLTPRTAPTIGNLKELRKLTLCGRFTDTSLLFGIAQCSKLYRLHLESNVLSPNARLIVKCGIPKLEDIRISKGFQLHHFAELL